VAATADRAKLLRLLAGAIKLFEPRLLNVRIVPLESNAVGIQELRFRIEGLLAMDPSPEPVSFDTVVELRSSTCRVSGGPNAG
jgi:type VI secretion system protein ImpF